MYIPPNYREEDPEAIRDFIREHAFGILVCPGNPVPMATHLPLELSETASGEVVLTGHFARANPQWKHIQDGAEVLCIFNGPHAYVSSSWYQEEEVPTWNYMAVHLTGTYRQQTEAELWASLKALVDRYEADSEAPVRLEDLSEKTLRQVRGVVGFTIAATRLEAAFKLSQGREEDHERIIRELQDRGGASADVASAMKGRCPFED